MKIFNKIVFCAVLGLIAIPTIAQQMEEPKSLLSPNVATLGTFREPEVALFTGTPSISIPLFEVPLHDYILPIELQYNGTSILVDQLPSWVGLGWNLSAGGVITRKVNDWPDDRRYTEECNYSTMNDYPNSGYYYNYFSLRKDSWYEFDVLKDSLNGNLTPFYYLAFYDTEPDEFHFSFPGYNGHFFLNHERKWVVQCDKFVSVELIPTTIYPPFPIPDVGIYASGFHPYKKQPACFAGFIITIENGTKFYFGNDTSAIDFCTDFFEKQQIMTANAWHLTKIILPNKNEITLSYQRQSLTNQMYCGVAGTNGTVISGGYGCGDCGTEKKTSLGSIKGMLLSPVYLQRISTPTLSIEFFKSISWDLQYRKSIYKAKLKKFGSDGYYMPYITNFTYYDEGVAVEHYWTAIRNNLKRYKLDSIQITSQNNLLKKVAFHYIEDDSIRLALSEIEFSDGSIYHFEYDHLAELPHYLSFRTDHWGFFNNTLSQIDDTSSMSDYYMKRQPSATFIKYGLLKKIYHPTGGITQFEYEPNDYKKQVSEIRWNPLDTFNTKRFGGGVRIRKISHYDNVGDEIPSKESEFFYAKNYVKNGDVLESSGISSRSFKYLYDYSATLLDCDSPLLVRLFSSYSILPYNSDDAFVGYSEVTEKKSSGGYVVYKFSNFSEYLDEAPLGWQQASQLVYGKYISNKAYRGLLLSKTEYDVNLNCLHKQSYSYTPNKSTYNFIRSLDWRLKYVCVPMCSCAFSEGFSYKYYTHTMVPETIRDVLYSANGDSIVKTTKNYYNLQYQMPTQIDVMTKTDTISQTIKYPFDLHPWGIQPYRPYINDFDRLCAKMKNEHYFLPLEVSNYKRGKVVNSTYYNYSEHNGLGQETYYAVDSVSTLGITEPLANFTPVSLFHKDDRYIVPAKQSCKYDAYGNIAEITTDGVPVSYIWGYNHAYVVAKVIGINEAQVFNILSVNQYLQFNSPTGPTLANLKSFQASVNATYPQAQCYTYQYNPLYGIISETDPKGQTLFYDYDAMGRLKEVYYKEDNVKRVVKKYKYHLKEFE